MPSSLPDQRLIQLVLSGDPAVGSELVDRFEKPIYTVLNRLCGLPPDHLDDAFNHVFVKLFEDDCRRLRSWKGESSLSTWLLAVVRNLGRDYREKELTWIRRTGEGGEDEGKSFRDDDMPTPEDELVVSRMELIIKGLLGSLEEVCRKIIDLRFMRDMSYKETALAAGLTVSGVGSRLHRCLETLAQLMKKKFPDLFEDRFNLDL